MKPIILKLMERRGLSVVGVVIFATLFIFSSPNAHAASIAATNIQFHQMTVGLIAIDPKTGAPRHLHGIQPNGVSSRCGDCGCVTIEGGSGASHYIIVTLKAASSQGWILSGSWGVNVPNAGSNGGGFGIQWSPNWSTQYGQLTPLSHTVYGVLLIGLTVWTPGGPCVAALPNNTWAWSG